MQDKDLSPWFNLEEQKPWEIGVYEILVESKKYPGLRRYSYWNGKRFGWIEQYPWLAEMQGHHATGRTDIQWRGLSSPSNPKRSGNPKVTRYVVIAVGSEKTVATFKGKTTALNYADTLNFQVRVKKIRFRSPE